ncbi:expressed unknown protein [Seminavis robusta]|uniref:Uncharacterized protein n=1 Tax=Seminavis robusta TaxID=568900 RepID=A0A9N8EVW4_9STRA|nr:expressed unknown protein [Seminavis robusta]|eukprot:Sro1713_g292970.1 n/a (138) ;mRNA; r:15086-15499
MNSSCAGTRTVEDYQMSVFANTALESVSKPYKERACCSAHPFMACKDFDEKESTINDEASNKTTITIHVDVDPDNELPVSGPVLVWSILPLFAAGIALVALVWYKRRRDDDDAEEDGEQSPEDRSEGPPEETNPSEP